MVYRRGMLSVDMEFYIGIARSKVLIRSFSFWLASNIDRSFYLTESALAVSEPCDRSWLQLPPVRRRSRTREGGSALSKGA